jgi:peptide chain release factor 2
MARSDFWEDRKAALASIGDLNAVRAWTEPLRKFSKGLDEVRAAAELLEGEEDADLLAETEKRLGELESSMEHLEFQRMLSGSNDRSDAILTVKPGLGGIDSQDWAEMLLRMYVYWAEKMGFTAEVLNSQPGEEAGIREGVLSVKGPFAYGYLRAENGIHRLVRRSPFDQNHRRHTSFASVFALPDLDESIEVDIRDEDLRIDTFRSSGAGGQHVNKTSSAVRITHEPSGIVVVCQDERSQHRNKEVAMRILRARLYQLEESRKKAEKDEMESSKKEATFGNQIRSYVLQPYQMVKDHRTEKETSDVDGVLAGNIQEFIEEYLRTVKQ